MSLVVVCVYRIDGFVENYECFKKCRFTLSINGFNSLLLLRASNIGKMLLFLIHELNNFTVRTNRVCVACMVCDVLIPWLILVDLSEQMCTRLSVCYNKYFRVCSVVFSL